MRARSAPLAAIILAVAGKYLGAWGVLAVFAVAALVIAALGFCLQRQQGSGLPGHIQDIPGYALPRGRALIRHVGAGAPCGLWQSVQVITPSLTRCFEGRLN